MNPLLVTAKSNQGYSMVEVLVAMAILMVAALGFSQLMADQAFQLKEVQNKADAAQLYIQARSAAGQTATGTSSMNATQP